MVVVVDYGRGNLFSIGQALRHLDAEFEVTAAPERVAQADRIILPGVGAFSDAMKGLDERGLTVPVKTAAAAGAPILGICVGCQMLLSRSEEFGDHAGLDLIPGTVARLPEPRVNDAAAIRIPNVGWRPLTVSAATPMLGGIVAGDMMYFVHSYAPDGAGLRRCRRDHLGQRPGRSGRGRSRQSSRSPVPPRKERAARSGRAPPISGN